MKFDFTKLTGAGNDFILLDGINGRLPELTPEIIQSLCLRRMGIGADGVLVIQPSNEFDYSLKYYNADGSSGMLCANGARASVIYAYSKINPNKKEFGFSCCGKRYSGEVINESEAVVKLPQIEEGKFETIGIDSKNINIYVADTGAPQAVLEFSEISSSSEIFDEFDFSIFAKKVRHHKKFLPAGINVNVIAEVSGQYFIRSFERGVEDETPACGTGIVAAAMFLFERKKEKTPIEIISRSKKKFIIDFRKKLTNFKTVSLRGHAAIVFNGNIDIKENK